MFEAIRSKSLPSHGDERRAIERTNKFHMLFLLHRTPLSVIPVGWITPWGFVSDRRLKEDEDIEGCIWLFKYRATVCKKQEGDRKL